MDSSIFSFTIYYCAVSNVLCVKTLLQRRPGDLFIYLFYSTLSTERCYKLKLWLRCKPPTPPTLGQRSTVWGSASVKWRARCHVLAPLRCLKRWRANTRPRWQRHRSRVWEGQWTFVDLQNNITGLCGFIWCLYNYMKGLALNCEAGGTNHLSQWDLLKTSHGCIWADWCEHLNKTHFSHVALLTSLFCSHYVSIHHQCSHEKWKNKTKLQSHFTADSFISAEMEFPNISKSLCPFQIFSFKCRDVKLLSKIKISN